MIKKLLTKKAFSCRAFNFYLSMLFLLFYGKNLAQVNTYSFSETGTGLTYSPITGTDLFGAAWDDNVANVTLPFTFNFDGTNYDIVKISSNGFIAFGGTASLATGTFSPLSSTTITHYVGAISAFGRDLINGGAGSSIIHGTQGVAPNRVFTVQYNNVARKGLTGAGIMNFQIRLYESTNIIEVWYDVPSNVTSNGTNFSVWGGQVGLRGPNNDIVVGNVFNRRFVANNENWPPTSEGTENNQWVFCKANSLNPTVTRFRWTPPCFPPSGLSFANLTSTTVDISWTAPAVVPAGYDFEIRSSGVGGSGPVGLVSSGSVAGTSTTATGLLEGLTYTLYVRSNCGGSTSSFITGPSFTLPCTATNVPYYLSFDPGSEGFMVPGLPLCTVNDNVGAGNNWETTSPVFSGGFFDEHLIYNFHPTNAANTWFITKGINLVAGSTYRLTYVYGGSSEFTSITNRMEVRYGTVGTGAGLATATLLDNHPEIKSSPFENIVTFTAPTSEVYYFGFRAYSAANNGRLYLDDISVDVSNCLVPTGLDAPTTLITSNNATLVWNAPSPAPANGYSYYVSTSSTPPGNGTPATGTVSAGTIIASVPNLLPNTTYYAWVRSNCGFGEFGPWSSGITFTTDVAPPTYCIPSGFGFAQDPNGIVNVTMGSINNTTGIELPNYYGDYSGLSTNVAQGATIPVSISLATGWEYHIRIWVDWNNDGDFLDAGELVYSGLANSSVPSIVLANFTVPALQPTGPRRMRIGGLDTLINPSIASLTPCRNGSWQVFEDYTINVIVPPPALTLNLNTIPAQCGLTDSPLVTITSNVNDFDVYSWSPSAGVTGTPQTGYIFNTSSTTTYILTASQTSGQFSTNTATFTYVANDTPSPVVIDAPNGLDGCVTNPALPLLASGGLVPNQTIFTENFNSGINGPGQFTMTNNSTGGANPAAAAWTSRPNGYTTPGFFPVTFNSNDNTGFVLANSDAQGGSPSPSVTRTRLTSPPIDLTLNTSATLSFFHHLDRFSTTDISRVQITTNGGSSWTDIATYLIDRGSPTNFVQEFINLNAFVGNVVQIRFDYQASWGWWWAIDNFRIFGSAPASITWSPVDGLFLNPEATIPYLAGTDAALVYALPISTTTYTASSTASTGCISSASVTVVLPTIISGTLNGNQNLCSGLFADVVLTGNSEPVARWEFSNDFGFSSVDGVYANTSNILTGAEIGLISLTQHVRAVISNGACEIYSDVVTLSLPSTIWNGSSWSNSVPTNSTRATFDVSGNYTITSDLNACSLIILNGTITVNSNVTLSVLNELVVAPGATLTFENNASLLQVNEVEPNVGNIVYRRNSTGMYLLDYTYWSSPVVAQDLFTFSPFTNFARKYEWNENSQGWSQLFPTSASHVPATVFSTPGRGFIVRAPGSGPVVFNSHTSGLPRVNFPGEFLGVPTNGTVTVPTGNTAPGWNLLGNPYPSALDVHAFLIDPANAHLDRTIKYWTHNTPITNNVYNPSDYATYNFTGSNLTDIGTGTAGPNTGVPLQPNLNVPGRYMAAGQGFVVDVLGGNGTGVATFRNSHRAAGNNTMFFRMAQTDAVISAADAIDLQERHRVWLSMSNGQNLQKSLLVGYVEGATNSYDNGYDGKFAASGYGLEFYSLLEAESLTIQGRVLPFDVTDTVPLGYFAQQAGSYTIELPQFDGLFENQEVYVEDLLTGVIHPLKESGYSFVTAPGRYDNRFVLRYTNETLSVNTPQFGEHHVVIYKEHASLIIQTQDAEMSEVVLYDMSGRRLASQQGDLGTLVRFDQLAIPQQVLMVEIVTRDTGIVHKKYVY